MGELSEEEIGRVHQYLASQETLQREAALKSQESFFSWLRKMSLGHIIGKIVDWGILAIKKLFGWG